MDTIIAFYSVTHIFISFIGALLLLAIWYNIRKRFREELEEGDNEIRVDKSLWFLALSMFVWVLSGGWTYFFSGEGLVHDTVAICLSGVNNACLIAALFYFSEAPSFIFNNRKNRSLLLSTLAVVAILSTSLLFLDGMQQWAFLPDVAFSAFLSFLLLKTFYQTFSTRDLKLVAYIAVLSIAVMFLSQLPEVFPSMISDFSQLLLKLVSKTSMIAICLVLGTSWVIRLAHTAKPKEMTIRFTDWGEVHLNIPSKNIYNAVIDFGSKMTQFQNLLHFAIQRKVGQGDAQYLLVGSGGAIKSQTYLTRIIDNINEILQLPEGQQLERKDLFTFVGQGKYRLRVVPAQIEIEKQLQEEFFQKTDR